MVRILNLNRLGQHEVSFVDTIGVPLLHWNSKRGSIILKLTSAAQF